MPNNSVDQKERLLALLNEAVKSDSDLRDDYQIGDKFKFIRDRLNALKKQIEADIASMKKVEHKEQKVLSADEQLVFVYLYNAQGNSLPTWQKFLNPKLFYEYSVNRPIYKNKKDIENYIRTKQNKLQHGFVTVVVNKNDILSSLVETTEDNPLIRIKEGGLKDFISFTHNHIDYELNDDGSLKKKSLNNK